MKKLDLKTQTKTGSARQRSAPVTRNKFYAIRRDIEGALGTTNWDAVAIGKVHGVGASTVRKIRQVWTWPKYLEWKESIKGQKQAGRTVVRKPVVKHVAFDSSNTPDMSERDWSLARDLQKYVIEQRGEAERRARRLFTWIVCGIVAVIWLTLLIVYVAHAA